jgi:type IV pilus assembly protein PilA
MALFLSAGCQKKEEPPKPATTAPATVEMVAAAERSRHFLAVNRQLELGGTLYAYADVDGDAQKLANRLQGVVDLIGRSQPAVAPMLKQDYPALLAILGANDIVAFGLSSVPDGTGYFRNRVFFHIPGERHGLLLGLGGKPGPFTHLRYAPADTDVFSESEFDLPVVYRTVKEVVAKVGGETAGNLFEDGLKKAGESMALSILDLINGMKGRASLVLRLSPERNVQIPGPGGFTVPEISLLVTVDGVGLPVETALGRSNKFQRSDQGPLHLYRSVQPAGLPGLDPIIAIQGSTLYLASTPAFLTECLAPQTEKTGLGSNAEFRAALAKVGTEGNGLNYVSPHFFKQLHRLDELNPSLAPQFRQILVPVLNNLPQADRALITLRTNLPDGILMRSYWNRSLKQDVAAMAVYNPLTVGLLAAMAIPAFQKVRIASQEKAVLNNLRQLAAAADQYYLENGKNTAQYNDLVGPTKYIKVLIPVAGENYRLVRFQQGRPLQIRMPTNGQMIQYQP